MPLYFFLFIAVCSTLAAAQSGDASVMQDLKKSLNSPTQLPWTDPDPCKWKSVRCSSDGRVTRIQIGNQNLHGGSLPPTLAKLTSLQVLEVMNNQLTGSLPSLAGLNSLQSLLLSNNNFTSIPPDFFDGMNSLQVVYLDYNPFSEWRIPIGLKSASSLQMFSATSANIIGPLPDFFGPQTLSSLNNLRLAFNKLEGPLPASLAGSSIQSLWLNGQKSGSRLNGSLSVLQNMTQLTQVWLHDNDFSGPLPDFTPLIQLQNFSVRQNSLTGVIPDSFVGLKSLMVVNLTNNKFQGKMPKFSPNVVVDNSPNTNSFCLSDPGVDCDWRVDALLDVAKEVGFPAIFSDNWKGNNPCSSWRGITCIGGNITVVNFRGMALAGTISRSFSKFPSLQRLILANNAFTGAIPAELAILPNLVELDVSNNQIYGKVPQFRSGVDVKTTGNVNIGKDAPPPPPNSGGESPANGKKKSSAGAVAGAVVAGVCALIFGGTLLFCLNRSKHKRRRSGRVQSPTATHSSLDNDLKIAINGGSSDNYVETGTMMISIQLLRSVTNNFNEHNILGRGGFGTVYKGELHDGTKIAVKRMELGVISAKGLDEFKSEISVLSKVRHRHLVGLLGYCLDGQERLLVYEYMPQGTLSRFLFNWKEEGLQPLEWTKRLSIALDVARGVEYLHGLAQQSFIHRDLKPSNILLGDDMRAKVADFGLVKLAPDGKASIATKLAGTFGYLAPEYAVTGRVTTKIDVFSFGVILMEMITGRKALDERYPDDSQHLVPWFRRMHINKDTFHKAIDPSLELDDETLASIRTVSELAGHCSAQEPYQRPDMGHVVNVLSSLIELWKPSEPADPDDVYGIDYGMTLPQALKKWQALEGISLIDGGNDSSHTSIPTRPSGFADSLSSRDGR